MAFEISHVVEDSGRTAHQWMLGAIQGLAEANGWATLRFDQTSENHELILRGEGLSGDEEIFIGFRCYQNAFADYYNIAVAGFTGYVAGNTWEAQPGFMQSGVPMHNQRIDYWLTVNPQRIAVGAKVGTPVYESGYVGKILPYARPGEFPYPLCVAGMLNGAAATRYSDTAHTMAFKGNRPNLRLRWLDGTWKQPQVYPWNNAYVGGSTAQLRDTNGQYPIMPVVLCEAVPNVFGELDGIGYVSNFNNIVESVVQVGGTPVVDNPAWTAQERAAAIVAAGGTPWVCLQDVARTSFNDYFAMRLD